MFGFIKSIIDYIKFRRYIKKRSKDNDDPYIYK